jgi:hypothetical protein
VRVSLVAPGFVRTELGGRMAKTELRDRFEAAMLEVGMAPEDVAVAVVDNHGFLVFFERMDNTQTASMDIAVGKARAAATYRRPTRVFADTINKGGPATGRFLQLRSDADFDLPVPGKPYSFRTLIDAQADGDLQTLRDRHKVAILRTPVEIERAQLEAWDRLAAELSKDPINKRIIDSQRQWFQRVVFYEQLNAANYRLAYEHVYKTKIPMA